MKFNATIEVPKGNRDKYEVDYEIDRIRPDRMLFTSTRYPDSCEFIDDSLGLDGDLLSTSVLLEEPTFPGCVITCCTLGMFRMSDEHGGDGKVSCVPAGDQQVSWHTKSENASEFHRLEAQHFFEVYKGLEPRKSMEGADWAGRVEAEKEILAPLARFREKKDPDAHTCIYCQGSPGRRQDSSGFMRRRP